MIFVNIIKSYRDIVAICDEEFLGKKFEEGDFQLDVKENFYNGELASKERVVEIMKKMSCEDASFNIVGGNSVSLALETGIISKEEIGKIANVPFALVLA